MPIVPRQISGSIQGRSSMCPSPPPTWRARPNSSMRTPTCR